MTQLVERLKAGKKITEQSVLNDSALPYINRNIDKFILTARYSGYQISGYRYRCHGICFVAEMSSVDAQNQSTMSLCSVSA